MMQTAEHQRTRYEIIRPLAEGGIGKVHLGVLHGLEGFRKLVAIKRIRQSMTPFHHLPRDFIREARLGGFLDHHNVVQVLGFEPLKGEPALIMEYIEGINLNQLIDHCSDEDTRIPLYLVAEIILQLTEGLQYLHTLCDSHVRPLNLIHRDLKPSNVLVSTAGIVKITDLGVARADLIDGDETRIGTVKGTPAYMSPEQARGDAIDQRSDLYSVGSILHELLMLEPLFSHQSSFAILRDLAQNRITSQLECAQESYAAPFMPLLRNLLTEFPGDRIQTAQDCGSKLRQLMQALPLPQESLTMYIRSTLPTTDAEALDAQLATGLVDVVETHEAGDPSFNPLIAPSTEVLAGISPSQRSIKPLPPSFDAVVQQAPARAQLRPVLLASILLGLVSVPVAESSRTKELLSSFLLIPTGSLAAKAKVEAVDRSLTAPAPHSEPGAKQPAPIQTDPPSCAVLVSATASGRLSLDGHSLGNPPIWVSGLAPGMHQFSAEFPETGVVHNFPLKLENQKLEQISCGIEGCVRTLLQSTATP